ncbi:MAG TPA: D-aminoacyl-tRNA deacylase [Thermotogota bacterium]|nr:D-aminoacyl-tRNA deacylase [Thermotogota bacterium]HPJ89104.1 D-aminoacyl-tRNA deacylase [Thermotogota bacterium]HPR96131.1 D-aminoacyl-tRNA deacylase [Thermotogota bacterium]
MRAVLQKVTSAKVTVDNEITGQIDKGLAVLIGVTHTDTEKDAEWLAGKIEGLRIFEDEADKLNLSVKDVGGKVLLVSQFTLFGDARKGRRPSFTAAASPEKANELYLKCGQLLEKMGLEVEYGQFRAHMELSLTNEGPVTILLDSEKLF